MPESPAEQPEWLAEWRAVESACQRIGRYVEGCDAKGLRADDLTYDAVVRNLQLISQAAAALPPAAQASVEGPHWRAAASFDTEVTDSLDRRNHDAVWNLAANSVPALLRAMQGADLDRLKNLSSEAADDLGRHARWPHEIPLKGWRNIGRRLWREMTADSVFIVAAGVAFYGLLAMFPALAALMSSYGLLFDPTDVQAQLDALARLLPSEAWDLVRDQLTRIVDKPKYALSLSAVFGAAITLWSARAGIGALMIAMNIVYGEQEKRGLLAWYGLSLLLTIGAIVYAVIALALIVAVPALLGRLGLGSEAWVAVLRWPLLALSTMFGLTIIYRYGPSRRPARWAWVTWGAVIATLLWLAGSVLFSFYIANFANYNETYGSVGAVIVLMLWFYVTALIVLLGAEFDAVTEQQTSVDSTVGPPRPMGQRGAYVADTLPPGG